MAVFDVIDMLVGQHDQMRGLCARVAAAPGDDKARLFTELHDLVHRHENGERKVVHPATRNSSPAGDRIGVECMAEEGPIERALDGLQALGVADAGFDSGFAEVHRAIDDHTAHEEKDEFPLLRRYVTAQRLHMMAGELHDVQVLTGR